MRKVNTWIQGVGGQGKTLLAKAIAAARIRAGGRVVIVDPNAVFDGWGRVVGVLQAADALKASPYPTPLALVVRPAWGEDVSPLWGRLFAAGGLLVVVDEAASWASNEAGALDKQFLELVIKGRNRWVDLLTTSQAPTTLHPQVRQQWDVYVSFKQAEPDYAKEIAKRYLRRADLAPALLALPKFHYLRATLDGALSRGVVQIPPPPHR